MLLDSVREFVLDNGLKVIALEERSSPTVSFQVWYRVGSRCERSGLTGISHIFEHLMFRGTERFPAGVFDRTFQELGMTYNAFTSEDFTAYFEEMASDRLEAAMVMEADRMPGLKLEEEPFQAELSVIREERRQTVEDPPLGLLTELVEATVFQVHPYHWPVIGWMSDLESITIDDVRNYYHHYYRPNNAVLVVVGDVAPNAVLDLAVKHFGSIPRGPEVPEVRASEPPQRGERTVSVRKSVRLPGLIIAYRAPASKEPEARVLNVAEFLLLHGRSSRLYRSLIYSRQLATGVSGGIHLRRDPSTFTLTAGARPGVSVETLRDAIFEGLAELAETPVEPEELQKVKNAIESDFAFSQESHSEVAHNLGEEECRGSWRDYPAWLEDNLRVTPEQIQETARAIFTEANRTVGYLVPESTAEGEMDEELMAGTDEVTP